MARGVFLVTMALVALAIYIWIVAFIGSAVAAVVLFAVGALTGSTAFSFVAAGISVVAVAVFVALFFIGAAKVLDF